jgi:crotonobetainyl-CoA:carnitine CoA-transferase CaiB-like acyl-CoA transferase
MGDPDWGRDPRFATMRSRTEHVDFVLGTLSRLLEQRTTAEWLELLRAAEIPAMPLFTTEDLLTDDHLDAVGFWHRTEVDGELYRFTGIATGFSRTPGRITGPGPRLGEHGREILAGRGFSPAEIDELVAAGVLVDPPAKPDTQPR